MKIYLAGPMRGIPNFNFPAFGRAAKNLRALGYEVFSPAERDNLHYGTDIAADNVMGDEAQAARDHGFSLRDALASDTEFICRHAEGIALLPDWERSKGASAEKALAEALDLRVVYIDKDGHIMALRDTHSPQ